MRGARAFKWDHSATNFPNRSALETCTYLQEWIKRINKQWATSTTRLVGTEAASRTGHLFRKTVSFVMMWRRAGIRLADGKCSLGRQVFPPSTHTLRLFTWELKSQTDTEMLVFWESGKKGWSHTTDFTSERLSIMSQTTTKHSHLLDERHIKTVSKRLIRLGIVRNWSILVQFQVSLNDCLTERLMIGLVILSEKENNRKQLSFHSLPPGVCCQEILITF